MSMPQVKNIEAIMESWAPLRAAWEKDNVGLQTGDSDSEVRGVLVALELTSEVLHEAEELSCNFIITHHPVIFRPLSSITNTTAVGRLLLRCIRKNINVYAAHTNLDFTRDGVSFALAGKLGLENLSFLHREGGSMKKIAVFVPPDRIDDVSEAMSRAGAGLLGDYESCSFRTSGTGTYRPLDGARPYSGSVGKLETAGEIRLEMVAPVWNVPEVISAMIAAHPYEEVAYDIFPTESINPNFGAGVLGNYSSGISAEAFVDLVKDRLGVPAIRRSAGKGAPVRKVAVCGGSGSDLLPAAIRIEADAFVTADIKYHTFFDASDRILLIDAGHYETEAVILDRIVLKLKAALNDSTPVHLTKIRTNPILYS